MEIKGLIEKVERRESVLTQTLTAELLTRDLFNEQAWIWLIEEFERNQDQITVDSKPPHKKSTCFGQAHYSLARLHHEMSNSVPEMHLLVRCQ